MPTLYFKEEKESHWVKWVSKETFGPTFIHLLNKYLLNNYVSSTRLAGVSNLWPRMAMNVAQHNIINLLKTLRDFFLFLLVFIYLMCGPRQLF